jgi:fructose 5-dehydrogenase small subunit
MLKRKPASFATRRAIIGGGVASAAVACAPSWSAAAATGFDTFLSVSMKLTGRSAFDPLLAERVHAALVKADARFNAKTARLDLWFTTHGSTSGHAVIAALRATQPELAETVGKLMRAWYLGIVTNGSRVEAVSYERALMFDPVRDVLVVPSYCSGDPADWAKKPPPV